MKKSLEVGGSDIDPLKRGGYSAEGHEGQFSRFRLESSLNNTDSYRRWLSFQDS